jgi:hypothetical protein
MERTLDRCMSKRKRLTIWLHFRRVTRHSVSLHPHARHAISKQHLAPAKCRAILGSTHWKLPRSGGE